MTQVTKKNNTVSAIGHANSKIVCAMVTAQTVGLMTNIIERLGERPDHVLEPGVFILDTTVLSEKAMDLVDAYLYSLRGIASSYPAHVEYSVS